MQLLGILSVSELIQLGRLFLIVGAVISLVALGLLVLGLVRGFDRTEFAAFIALLLVGLQLLFAARPSKSQSYRKTRPTVGAGSR
jgi:hypothetical protein